MLGSSRVLAVILARCDSKRLPRKNILMLHGKPLIEWIIDAALGSKYIDTVVVSSDCEEIIAVAKKAGADVPFIRPKELASDTALTIDVVKHAIIWYSSSGYQYEIVIILQPTSP